MSDLHPAIIPAIRYRDPNSAARWLAEAFGFRDHASHRGADGSLVHAEMTLGNGMVMFGSGSEAGGDGNPWAEVPLGIYAVVADIDAHYARARAAGAEIVMPLRDTDYGARDYSVRDLEGNLWCFGTYDPWASGAEAEGGGA